MTFNAGFVRPLFAESFDLARLRSSDFPAVFGNRNIIMADVAFAYPVSLMPLVVEGYAVFEVDDVRSNGT